MAQGFVYVCSDCKHEIQAWDDGNPYFLNAKGTKVHVYHPDQRLSLCIGNDDPHLCLSCGADFLVDSREPIDACPKCGSDDIRETTGLEGARCPYCKTGTFKRDSSNFMIS